MKFAWFSFGLLGLAAATGCVQSHRPREVVYYTPASTPPPVYTPPVNTPIAPPLPPPPPTSEGSEARVYTVPPEPISPPSEPPPGVSGKDLAIAESISKLLKNDAHMASISGNVQTTVDQGVVILRGTTPTENAMDEIAMRIGKLPGVGHIENHLAVSNR